ncbi:branched-chain amino acid ABC transporter permease [Poseidonocella sp. HB161398]|uniref:branched-chain amino acid ABC transporter permease n=1 Tax=Poseidonocella sp. HB161398 TaxID=2320855 RepID=UPI001108AC26|nr:branched-chain amino acid ABC transporter permease [Poseidonocella sp. HB161398]
MLPELLQFLQAVLDGLLLGGVYGVIAIGLTLIFGTLNVVNFAQAEFTMIGMYVAWFLWHALGIDPLLGAVISFAAGFALGAAVEASLIRPVMKSTGAAQIFLTVGLMMVLENGALLLFGSDYRSVLTPYQTTAYRLGPLFVSAPYLYAFVAALLGAGLMWLVMMRSWLGRAIRATAQDRMAAELSGINTRLVHMAAFGIGTGMSAFGGGVILPYSSVSPTAGAQYVVIMFLVVVLGGLGNAAGALAGGLAAGVIQSLSGLYAPIQMQNLTLFVLFLALLYFRPNGLLGGKRA